MAAVGVQPLLRIAATVLAVGLGAAATAEGPFVRAGDITLTLGQAQAAGPTARTGAGYFVVTNTGTVDDRLVGVESPAAERVEIHATEVQDGVARMIPLEEGVRIPARDTVGFLPRQTHLMFLGLTEAWNRETGVPVTLHFQRAGAVEIVLQVTAGPGQGAHQGH